MKLDKRQRYKSITINNFNAKLWEDFIKVCNKKGRTIKNEVEELIKEALHV